LEAIREHGAVRNVEIQLRTKSQALVDVLVSVEQIEINGQACALTIQYDITELKHAQREVQLLNADLEQRQRVLEATNKELEVFSHSIAHDLRVPLRIIDRFSQLLFEDYYDRLDDTGREYLQHARAASQQMGQLIDALLNLSRINRSELTKEEINLSQLAQEITSGLQTGQPEREVEFILQEGLTAHANRSLVHVALENLIRNAWKSTRDQSPARIEFGMTQAIDEQIYFVRDNGTDFDLKYANKVFDASQNLHDLKALAGTRIGLAATQRIIHRHGGRIWAESDVNQGAIFYFTL
jgi:light-regulated signal transduction histidine kinase (bacteriophytochrome)